MPPQLPLRLFSECNALKELCARSVSSSERVREISMNAAITAGHTGTQKKIFGMIANQIGSSAMLIHRRALDADTHLGGVTYLVLDFMKTSGELARIDEGANAVARAANLELVARVLADLWRHLQTNWHETQRGLNKLQPKLRSLIQAQYRLFASLNALRIEASTLEGRGLRPILALCESLAGCTASIAADFERLQQASRVLSWTLSSPFQTIGDAHAQAHAI